MDISRSHLSPPARAMAAYFEAKDCSRPHLLDQAFTDDARLLMDVRTAAISFPPLTQGREAIGDVLVRQFNERYDNVYTVCAGEPPAAGTREHACAWMVAMTDKQSRELRVGCGRYDWVFESGGGRISEFRIHIACMQALPSQTLAPVMGWVAALPAPWCELTRMLGAAPALPALESWREALMNAARSCLPGGEAPASMPRSGP